MASLEFKGGPGPDVRKLLQEKAKARAEAQDGSISTGREWPIIGEGGGLTRAIFEQSLVEIVDTPYGKKAIYSGSNLPVDITSD